MLFTWPADYGPTPGIFRLAEPFLTPRLFAEGLGILALACVVRGRWKLGLLPLGLAFALHPLMACGPLLAGALFLAWEHWRTRWRAICALLATGAILLAGATAADVPPFDRLLAGMDAEWLALVAQRSPMVAWSAWHAGEWLSRTLVAFSLVATAGCLADGATGRLFRCAAVLAVAGLLANWAGTGLASNLLLMQVQPWRLLWVTQLCSWLALAWLFAAYWRSGPAMRVLLAALCLAALTRNSIGGAVAMLAGVSMCLNARRPLAWTPRRHRAAMLCLLALSLAWLLEVSHETATVLLVQPRQEPGMQPIVWTLTALERGGGAAAGTALLLLAWRWGGSAGTRQHLGAFALVFASLGGAAVYAAAAPHRPYLLSPQGERAVQAAFLPLIPPHAVVYWRNNVAASWLTLHRSNYASSMQTTGLVFNRGTAIEGARRMQRLLPLGGEDALLAQYSLEARMAARRLPQPTRAALLVACGDPALDFVVLNGPLGNDHIAQARDEKYGETYYLYDCARLRGR